MVSANTQWKRVVVKIGSALLVDRETGLKRGWLDALADDIAELHATGSQVLVVSSGAIALGRSRMPETKRPLRLEENQAAAAIGQIHLARAYSETLDRHGIAAGQILLTLGDTEERRRYLNARETISTLLGLGAVPVINENDSVATSEIRYGDNDRLAARVATMTDADLLVLLSDVDGLYTGLPGQDPEATLIPRVDEITPEIEALAGDAGSELSRGGMVTKLEAARIATSAGTTMAIASGHGLNPLARLLNGGAATWFAARENPVAARKKWIAGQIEVSGSVRIDEGAAKALMAGKSLLPAGVTGVQGVFSRGDTISILDGAGNRLGCGMSAYDAADAARIAGRQTAEIEAILGFSGRGAVIHRDNLALDRNS